MSQVKPPLQTFPIGACHQDISTCSSARVYRHACASQIQRRQIPRVSGKKNLPGMKPSIAFWCECPSSIRQHRHGDCFLWESRGGEIPDSCQDHIFSANRHAPLSLLLILKHDKSGIILWTGSPDVTLAVDYSLGVAVVDLFTSQHKVGEFSAEYVFCIGFSQNLHVL